VKAKNSNAATIVDFKKTFLTVENSVDSISIFRDAKSKTDLNRKIDRPAEEIKQMKHVYCARSWQVGSRNVPQPRAASNVTASLIV